MRLVGLPTEWKLEEGLLPLDVQDVDIHATPDELQRLADFFGAAAASAATAESSELSLEFADSKPDAQTGIWVTVHVAR